MMISLYFDPVYFDAEWGLHHLVRRIVGAVYSGLTELARHFTKILDFILTPKRVTVENIWTGYATASSITVPVNISSLSNSYVVVVVIGDTINIGGATLNGSAMTDLVGSVTTRSARIFGKIPGSTGAQNVVVTNGSSQITRVIVYQLSGVNQTTPILDAQTATTGGATSLTTPNLVSDLSGLIIDGGTFASGTVAAASGQTTTIVNLIVSAGSLVPTSTTMTTTWTTTSSSAGRVVAVSLNPA